MGPGPYNEFPHTDFDSLLLLNRHRYFKSIKSTLKPSNVLLNRQRFDLIVKSNVEIKL